MLNENLIIKRQLRVCSIFNKTTKFIQCYKCYKYEHITTQCFYNKICEHCVNEHSTRSRLYT